MFVMLAICFLTPASGTILYSVCSFSCTSSSTSYGSFEARPEGAGLTFTLVPGFTGALNPDGTFTDATTGALFTGIGGLTPLALSGSTLVEGTNNGAGILITLPSNTYAVAVSVGGSGSFIKGMTVGGGDFELSSPGIYGIISSTAISSIFIGNTTGLFGTTVFNSFMIGTNDGGSVGGEAPEPSSWALLATGLAALPLWRRRRYRETKPPEIPLERRSEQASESHRPGLEARGE